MDSRVCIVDSDPETAQLLAERLRAHGFEVTVVASEAEAGALMESHPPNLSLLTWDGPGLDAAGLLRRLRTTSEAAGVAWIGLSRSPGVSQRVACLELGAVDYIQWPVPEAELIARVKRHLTVVQVRAALQQSEARFRSVTESAIDAIISADRQGRILSWNRAAEAIFGHTAAEAHGQPLEIIIPERFRAAHAAGLKRVADGGQSRVIGSTVELAAIRKDGSELPIELSLATWTLGPQRYFTGIVRDISTRKADEDRLRQVADDLARSHQELQAQHEALRRSQDTLLAFTRRNKRLFDAITSVMPGSELDGRYRIDERLATGGYGVVFAGVRLKDHTPVAIKVFRPSSAEADTAAVRRFRREDDTTRRVEHPNAVRVLDAGVTTAELPYIVMERLTGETVSARIRRTGRFATSEAARVLADVCSVLVTAHGLNIVHRDISASNVFLHQPAAPASTHDPLVKVLDFGIAAQANDGGPEAPTETAGPLIGTPQYMAPERLTEHRTRAASDVYSVGRLAIAMLGGHDEVPADEQIPSGLRSLITRMTDADPDARPAAAECETVFRRLADRAPALAAP